MSSVRVLMQARDAQPEEFRRAEPDLILAARLHTADDLKRITAFWCQAVESDQTGDAEEKIRDRRDLHASVSFLGMVRIDGDLDPESERRF